jgi:hypothetical protein
VAEDKLTESLRKFLEDLSTNAVEERVIEYVVREVRNGRKLEDTLSDPFVKNRLSEERLAHVLENPGVINAIEQQIASAFRTRDFGFSD